MTQEGKKMLLKDICERLPYHIKGNFNGDIVDIISVEIGYTFNSVLIVKDAYTDRTSWESIDKIKPYLRPMSSMSEEEREEFRVVGGVMSYSPQHDSWAISAFTPEAYDWLNAHHFDYRGLIPMGLALEAPKGMYK